MYIGKRYYANGPQFSVFGADKAAEIHAASCRVLQAIASYRMLKNDASVKR